MAPGAQPLELKQHGTEALARQMPFNENKPSELALKSKDGRAHGKPEKGMHTTPASPVVRR